MSGKIQVGPLSGFTPVSGIENVWRKGRLSLSLLTALGSARLEQSIRDLLENTLEADSILIVAFGYAPADAVWALNQRLAELGIKQEYPLDGLPTKYVSDEHSVWASGHTCTGDDLAKLREFLSQCQRLWMKDSAVDRLVRQLYRTRRPPMPPIEYYQFEPTGSGKVALWSTDEFPPYGRDIYVLWEHDEFFVKPDDTFMTRSRGHRSFVNDILVGVSRGDLILTLASKRYARRGETVILAYKVTEIFDTPTGEHWIEGTAEEIPVSLLAQDLKESLW